MDIGRIKYKELLIPQEYDHEEYREICKYVCNVLKNYCFKDSQELEYKIEETYFLDLEEYCPLPPADLTCLKKLSLEEPTYKEAAEDEIEGSKYSGRDADHVYEMSGLALMIFNTFRENEDALRFNHTAFFINKMLEQDDAKLDSLYVLTMGDRSPESFCKELSSEGWAWPTTEQYCDYLTNSSKENLEHLSFEQALGRGLENLELYSNSEQYDLDMFHKTRDMPFKDCECNSLKQSFLKLESSVIRKHVSNGKYEEPELLAKFSHVFANAFITCTEVVDPKTISKTIKNMDQHLKFYFGNTKISSLDDLIRENCYKDLEETLKLNSKEILKQSFIFSLKKQGITVPNLEEKAEHVLDVGLKRNDFIYMGLDGKERRVNRETIGTSNVKVDYVDDPFTKAFKKAEEAQISQNHDLKI